MVLINFSLESEIVQATTGSVFSNIVNQLRILSLLPTSEPYTGMTGFTHIGVETIPYSITCHG